MKKSLWILFVVLLPFLLFIQCNSFDENTEPLELVGKWDIVSRESNTLGSNVYFMDNFIPNDFTIDFKRDNTVQWINVKHGTWQKGTFSFANNLVTISIDNEDKEYELHIIEKNKIVLIRYYTDAQSKESMAELLRLEYQSSHSYPELSELEWERKFSLLHFESNTIVDYNEDGYFLPDYNDVIVEKNWLSGLSNNQYSFTFLESGKWRVIDNVQHNTVMETGSWEYLDGQNILMIQDNGKETLLHLKNNLGEDAEYRAVTISNDKRTFNEKGYSVQTKGELSMSNLHSDFTFGSMDWIGTWNINAFKRHKNSQLITGNSLEGGKLDFFANGQGRIITDTIVPFSWRRIDDHTVVISGILQWKEQGQEDAVLTINSYSKEDNKINMQQAWKVTGTSVDQYRIAWQITKE